MLICHQRTGRSDSTKAFSAARPRSMPDPPMRKARLRSSVSCRARPAGSSEAMMITFGLQPGSPGMTPSSFATIDTRSMMYWAASPLRLATPMQIWSSQRASPRRRLGAPTSLTKLRIISSSGRPVTSTSPSSTGSDCCGAAWLAGGGVGVCIGAAASRAAKRRGDMGRSFRGRRGRRASRRPDMSAGKRAGATGESYSASATLRAWWLRWMESAISIRPARRFLRVRSAS